ncbi:MAG TPA: carboxypeptidase-like regulatory domain-containing protein [Planctomycetota bacterium]
MLTAGEVVAVRLGLPPAGSVRGTVVDAEGRPVAGADVAIGSGHPDDAMLPGTRTSRAGAFVVDGVPAGEVMLRVSAHGFWRATLRALAGSEPESLTITLCAAPRLDGVVVDDAGRPQPGVLVEAREPGTNRPLSTRVRTDAAGRFSLPCEADGPVVPWLRREGANVETVLQETFVVPRSGVVVRLAQPAGSVQGRLCRDGVPLPDVALLLLTDDGRRRAVGTSARGTGRFAFGQLPPGSYSLRARHSDREFELVRLTAASCVDVELGDVAFETPSPR